MHYYKFNIADWYLSTSHLTVEEEAVYFRLINYYFDIERPIPIKTQPVFRRLRLANYSVIADQILDEFFTKTESGYIHARCEVILKEYRAKSKKNKANGAKGGRPRAGAAPRETQEKPSGLISESETKGNQEPLTTNQEPLTTNQEKDKPKQPKAPKAPDEIELLFDKFWQSGIRKADKKRAKVAFGKVLKSKADKLDFTLMLCDDIAFRLNNLQQGFSTLHPTTYLNNERWTDEQQVYIGVTASAPGEFGVKNTRDMDMEDQFSTSWADQTTPKNHPIDNDLLELDHDQEH